MLTWLMLATALVVLVFLAVLVIMVLTITRLLTRIGGQPTSLLAKLRLGLRAIESETAHLSPMLGQLNQDLGAIASGLTAAHGHLQKTIVAAQRQEDAGI